MKALVALVPLSVLACASGCNSQLAPGNTYTVMIDPAFTPDQISDILGAADDWTSKIPDLTLISTVSQCSGVNPRIICIHPSNGAAVDQIMIQEGYPTDGLSAEAADGQYPFGVTKFHGTKGERGDTSGISGVDGGEVFIAMDLIASDYAAGETFARPLLAQVSEHEMGHAMGLEHHVGTYLMNPGLGGSCNVATCNDVAQWYYVRYQQAPANCSIPACDQPGTSGKM